MERSIDIRRITVTALMAALIMVLTMLVRIPTPAGGYIHLGDAGIAFAAYAFGPVVGMVAGGVGTGLADLFGFPQWAIFSLVIHGIQGLVMGLIVRRSFDKLTMTLSTIAGTLIIVSGYFVASVIMSGVGTAMTEIVPNTIQGLSGGLIGIPLYVAVKRAYPPLLRFVHHSS